MGRILYFDCFSGASGDMILGALLDAGLPLDELKRALGGLAGGGCEIGADRVLRAGISATKFTVLDADGAAGGREPVALHHHDDAGADHHHHPHDHAHSAHAHPAPSTAPHHHHRSLPEIYSLIDRSILPAAARDRARGMFARLAEAEAAVHQMPVERVHLHEVGALDSVVDIVGTAFGLEWLGADRIVSSPLNVGGGQVETAHGLFPVPAPATVRLLRGVPVYSSGEQAELVTPTGALIVTEYASEFGPVPPMTLSAVGYGAGDRNPPHAPNVLRILVGEAADGAPAGRVVVLECEIDDMNPQIFGPLMDRLYAAGALEVFFAPVQMKKNRPGTLVTVIGAPERRRPLVDILFAETTTIGVRYQEVARECLERKMVAVETPFGTVRVKVAHRDGAVLNAAPEFDDCLRLATERGVPVKDVQAAAVRAYLESR